MDFTFGEIREPSSRAFYDDYNDSSLNLPFQRPIWTFKDGKESFPKKVDNFILIDGSQSHSIIQPSIQKNTPVAKLEGPNCQIYEFSSGDFVCVVEEKNMNYFNTITELLKPWIEIANNCSIVSLQSTSDFIGDSETSETCLVRSVVNSKLPGIPNLEVPGFVTGAGAGVASYRKFIDLDFSCYVIYIDLCDVFAIRTTLNLLKRLGLPYDETTSLSDFHHKSNLYM